MDITYAVVVFADLDALSQENKDQLLNAVFQTSIGTLRRSVTAPDEAILKWNSEDPNPCEAVGLAHTTYTYEEIKVIVATVHWSDDEV